MNLRRRQRRQRASELEALRVAAERGRVLVEASREIVVVLDERKRVLAASSRAREALDGLEEGRELSDDLLEGRVPVVVPYDVDGRREFLLYLNAAADVAAYEELRSGFTAAVSHELRTPLARLSALLETALLPGSDPAELVERARAEIEQARELIDDVLFLTELETGRAVVSLGSTPVLPTLESIAAELAERAARAGVRIVVEAAPELRVPLRPRMLRVVAENLAENAVRYAGPGSTLRLSAWDAGDTVVLRGSDDGAGVDQRDLPRLFERFYRADRARASRGTGLGLAIVKHVVTAAGGTVQADGGPGRGLEIRCIFPTR